MAGRASPLSSSLPGQGRVCGSRSPDPGAPAGSAGFLESIVPAFVCSAPGRSRIKGSVREQLPQREPGKRDRVPWLSLPGHNPHTARRCIKVSSAPKGSSARRTGKALLLQALRYDPGAAFRGGLFLSQTLSTPRNVNATSGPARLMLVVFQESSTPVLPLNLLVKAPNTILLVPLASL